ncbi:DUF2283 domain-containing protein [Bradyrhizobium sp.]|uniref:DUF2283 domain-containing protein n=1 Tax=Bradyrhizobium sp. TaxID=376 RepID=UPI004038293C
MRVRIDQSADAVYLNLSDGAVSESEEVADGIVVDYDTDGRVVGIEILDASKRAGNPETLKTYSFELPGVA